MSNSDQEQVNQEDQTMYNTKEAIIYQLQQSMKNSIRKQYTSDPQLRKIHENYIKLQQIPLGIDEILLKLDDPLFRKQKNFTVNDIEKLQADKINYIKHLMSMGSSIFPNELINLKRTKQGMGNGVKKVKLENFNENAQFGISDEEENANSNSMDESYDNSGSDDNENFSNDDYD